MLSGMDKLEHYLRERGGIGDTRNRLLREVVYERLFDAIRNVHLQSGDVLSEPRISKALGISRTPVREALHLLTQEGLLEVIPGRAILVATPTIQKIFDTLQMRELLEPEMMRQVSEAITEKDLEKLRALTGQMEKAARTGDRPAWSKADNQWHEIICKACPNNLLGEAVLQTRNHVFIISADENVTDQFLIDGTQEHREIVQAIIGRQGEKAKQLAQQHIRNLKVDMIKRYNIGL